MKRSSMPTFNHTFQVRAPLRAVADFHRSTHALKRLTPFPMVAQLHRVDPLGEGSISEFTLWFGPFLMRWTARHNHVDALRGFTDEQTSGPLLRWRHKHVFKAVSGGLTQVNDQIEYQHRPGLRHAWTRLLYSPPMLRVLFAYRAWATRRALKNQSPGVVK